MAANLAPLARRSIGVVALATALALSCADMQGDGVVIPSAPDIRAADAGNREVLQGTMWRIASLAGRLEALVESPEGPAAHREEIDDLLARIDAAVARLQTEEATAGHRLVAQNGGAFRMDVQAARADTALEPPRFGRAGAIYDACQRCHGD